VGYRIVVIGTSLGGLRALVELLGGLPADFALPLAVVQHRSPDTGGLAALLQSYTCLEVLEAEDKQTIERGRVYLAPPDYHMLVEQTRIALSTDVPVVYARPSIDVLFESAAIAYGAATIGVILTGASEDGAAGLAYIRRHGGLALVQDPADAACAVMPRAALEAAGADLLLPLAQIAPALLSLVSADPARNPIGAGGPRPARLSNAKDRHDQ